MCKRIRRGQERRIVCIGFLCGRLCASCGFYKAGIVALNNNCFDRLYPFYITIARYDAAGRLLHILLLFNERFGEEQPGQRYLLDLGLNQTDLASLVGVRREWVNRILQFWSKKKLIEYEGGKLIILDLARVKQERDSRLDANLDQTDW